MKAVIMAAGLGTRLRPLTDETPKPLLTVAGRPILERTLDALPSCIDRIVIVVGYRKERIIAHVGAAHRGRPVEYVEQTELKGTGHAVHACRHLLERDPFIVLNGDDLYDEAALMNLAEATPAIVVADPPAGWKRFDSCDVSSDGRFIGLRTGGDGPVNAGAYALDARFFDYPLVPIKDGAEFGLPQTIALMAKGVAVRTVRASRWIPVGTHEELAAAEAVLTART